MLKAIGCYSECQVRQIHFVFQSCLINLFTLSICFDVILLRCNYALKHWSQLYEMQCLDPPGPIFFHVRSQWWDVRSRSRARKGPAFTRLQNFFQMGFERSVHLMSRWQQIVRWFCRILYIFIYMIFYECTWWDLEMCVCVQGEVHYGRTRHTKITRRLKELRERPRRQWLQMLKATECCLASDV